MKLFLIQPHHESGHPEREAELRKVERLNDATFGTNQYRPTGRPSFSELFGTCLHEHVNIIANSDIEIAPETLALFDRLPEGTVWCLSRWDLVGEHWTPRLRRDSQDVWAVRGSLSVDAPFTMGVPGCDNVLAHRLRHGNGMRLDNPVWSVVCRHHHMCGVRTYPIERGKDRDFFRLPRPYELVRPSHLP